MAVTRSLSSSSESSRSRSRSSSAASRSSKSNKSSSSSRSRSRSSSKSRSSSGSRSGSGGGGGNKSDKSNVSNSSSGSNRSRKLKKASDRKASTALLSKLSDSSDSEDEKEPESRKSSPSPSSPPAKKKKKADKIIDNDHFDDGLDDDLIGDAADRQMLEDMTEKEREEELFRRAERREELKKRFEITQKLKLQNKDKDKEDENKSDGEVSSASASASSDEDKKKSSVSRDKEKEQPADTGRAKGYEVKHASKFNALSQLKAQREEKEKKERERKEKEEKKKRKKDESGSDNSDMEKLAKKQKSKAADIYSSSSDSDANEERRRSSSSSSSSSSGSASESSGESDTERHSSKKVVKKATNVETKGDLEKIRISRFKLDKFVHLPIFKKTVVGCFVRIGIGNNPEKGAMYRVAEIVDICETAKVYDVMNNGNRSNVGLKLKHGKNSRVFRAQFVSNQPFTDSEFEKWKQTCKDEHVDLPTHQQVEEKVKHITYANTYRFSNSDVEKILANKEKFSKGPKNYAVHKAKLQRDKIKAENEGNSELVDELNRKLEEHEEKAVALDRARVGNLSTVSLINDRNRKGNIERAMKGLKQDEIRNKTEDVSDPFTRRKTFSAKPKKKTEDKNAEVAETPALKEEQDNKKKEKENVAKDGYIVTKKSKSEDIKPVKKEVTDIFGAHDFDIEIDIVPTDKHVAMNSVGVRPAASINAAPLGPTKKSIKLEDYKKRKGII